MPFSKVKATVDVSLNTNEIIVVVIVGIILVFLFYYLVYSIRLPSLRRRADKKLRPKVEEGRAGEAQTCPVCSARLNEGQLVSSAAFPAAKGSNDRLMHIRGCTHCIIGKRERQCPVCYSSLETDQYLISRLFDRSVIGSSKRSHVHVVGCAICKGPPSGRPM